MDPPGQKVDDAPRLPPDQDNDKAESGRSEGIMVEEMSLDDLRTALEWARLEGWNPGYGDAEPYFDADEKGFFMAKTPNGECVASASGVRYGEHYGFVGMYICAPKYRNKGYGTTTFGYAIHHLKGRVVGLDAVVTQCSNYAKWGFAVEHENIRFGGTVNLDELPPLPIEVRERVVVEEVKQERIDIILDFDEKHVPSPRERFVRGWLGASGHVARVAMVGNDVKGYGVLRPCYSGPKIGPLFADSVEVADMLMRGLLEAGTSRDTAVFIDIPAPNQAALNLAERLGLTKMWQTCRMYRGAAPELPLERVFAITSLEMG